MNTRRLWIGVVVAAAMVLAAGGVAALPGALAPGATVASKINYQGRLTDAMGNPLDGTYPMRFQLYDDAAAGTLWWDSGEFNVEVNNGAFSTDLSIDAYHFDGKGLWLRIWVDGDWLTPRQELLPVPYALNLRPGAEMEADAPTNWLFRATNTSSMATGSAIWGAATTGSAVYGNSAGGYGLRGYSDTGNALVANSNTKTAGVFDSNQGYGIRVNADGTDHWDHAGYFTSNFGYGVYGVSANNYGVRGEGNVAGVRGSGNSSGVSGSSDGGDGVYGSSNTLAGVYGSSQSYYGVEGTTWNTNNNYGLFTYDNLYALNYHLAGAMMHLAQNGGDEALEPGDVVVLVGVVEPAEAGGPLIIQVARASEANSAAVAGVVYRGFNVEAVVEGQRPEAGSGQVLPETTLDGPVPPGEHLLLVVQGPARVKVRAAAGTIQPGDLLCSAAEAGYATGVDAAAPGTILGKAMESPAADQDQIYVLVTLR
ncbi:MAG: hypothetical protein JXA93_11495 [Anaerolineae bacterium]|nr:hypothetical protein [Anaerolineae bacterium]